MQCKDIRCQNCGRMLARETDGVLHIKNGKNGEQILIESGKVHFICPGEIFTFQGKKKCGNTTRVENDHCLTF